MGLSGRAGEVSVERARPTGISETDYLADRGLDRIEELVAKLPQGFEIDQQVYPKTVVATLRFEDAKDVMERAEDVGRLMHAAMCTDTLAKNLRAERAEVDRLSALTVGDPTSIYHEAERYRRALERIAAEPAPGTTVSARNIAKTALDPTFRGDPHGRADR